MAITIRKGVAGDAAVLAEIAARTFRETFAPDNNADDLELHLAEGYSAAQQLGELVDPGIETLLVEIDGQLAGYAQVRSGDAPRCVIGDMPIELWRFYIDSSWHGRGIAQELMGRVKSEAVRCGARTLWLGVWERNHRAQAFYRKIGFTDVGSHVFMFGTDPQTDRIFVLPL